MGGQKLVLIRHCGTKLMLFCAVLADVDCAVSVSRGQLGIHLLGTLKWYLVLMLFSASAVDGCRDLEVATDLSSPVPSLLGWDREPVKGRAPPEGHSGGNSFADTSEKLHPELHASCQNLNRGCPAETMACFLFLPNNRKHSVVVTTFSLSEFNNPCLLPFFSLMCFCQQTCSLPAVVLSAEINAPCEEPSLQFYIRDLPMPATYYLHYISSFLEETFQLQIKVSHSTEIN